MSETNSAALFEEMRSLITQVRLMADVLITNGRDQEARIRECREIVEANRIAIGENALSIEENRNLLIRNHKIIAELAVRLHGSLARSQPSSGLPAIDLEG